MASILETPSELDMLVAFGVEPIESAPKDGYWCYELADNVGQMLRLAFNTIERNIYTSLYVNENEVFSVFRERAIYLRIEERDGTHSLVAKFMSENTLPSLDIVFQPNLKVIWRE